MVFTKKYLKETIKKAKKGDVESQFNLAQFYCSGFFKCAESNNKLSEYWLIKAAENGKEFAMYMLATRYETGRCDGIEKDLDKAIYWYTKLAEIQDKTGIEGLKRINEILKDNKC